MSETSEGQPGTKTFGLKMAKSSYLEWEKVMGFVRDLDDMASGNDGYKTNEQLGRWVRENMPPMLRVVYGYRVLVDNCCNDEDVLAFKPMLGASQALLDALKEILSITDRKHVTWDKARAAIGMAEGREVHYGEFEGKQG